MNIPIKRLIISSLLAASCPPAFAEVFAARVVEIQAGDTLIVEGYKNVRYVVHLAGVDSPETLQVHWRGATNLAKRKVLNRQVTLEPVRDFKDSKEITAYVRNEEGEDLGAALLSAGYAWSTPGDDKKEKTYREIEREARISKIGLWIDPNPVAPWIFRALSRKNEALQGSARKKFSAYKTKLITVGSSLERGVGREGAPSRPN
jgi:micrococcal nuclease